MAVHMNHSAVRMSTIEPELTTALDIKHQVFKPFSSPIGTFYKLLGTFCTFPVLAFQEKRRFQLIEQY